MSGMWRAIPDAEIATNSDAEFGVASGVASGIVAAEFASNSVTFSASENGGAA